MLDGFSVNSNFLLTIQNHSNFLTRRVSYSRFWPVYVVGMGKNISAELYLCAEAGIE